MDQFQRNRIFIFRYLTLAVIFFGAAFALNHFYLNRDLRSNMIRDRLEKSLREKEEAVEDLLAELCRNSSESFTFADYYRLVPPPMRDDPGLTLLVYQNDSIIYWSGNRIPFPDTLTGESFLKPFLYFGNGWFRVLTSNNEDIRAVGLILIKNDYPYQNEYLSNNFPEEFGIPPGVGIDTTSGSHPVVNANGQFLFSLTFPEKSTLPLQIELLVLALAIGSFIFLVILILYLYLSFGYLRERPLLLLSGFLIDVILLRLLILWLKIPGFVYEMDLFSPYHFATSRITPSLGDFLVNSIVWLMLAIVFYERFEQIKLNPHRKISAWSAAAAISAVSALALLLIITMRRLVLDSSIELNLNNLFGIDAYSGLAFLALSCLMLAFFLFSSRLLSCVIRNQISGRVYTAIAVAASVALGLILRETDSDLIGWVSAAFLMAYLSSFLHFSGRRQGFRDIGGALFYIVMFAVIATFVMDVYHVGKEKANRITLATELASRRDPLMEFEFDRIREEIQADTSLQYLLTERETPGSSDEQLVAHLKSHYFSDFWNKYDILITICNDAEVLNIRPAGYIANCFDYFRSVMQHSGTDSISPGLYFISQSANTSYIASFSFKNPDQTDSRIFIEMYFKYFDESGLGYPDLLIDKNVSVLSELSGYSYARYLDGQLIYKNGDFAYALTSIAFEPLANHPGFAETDGYSHFLLPQDERNLLVISRKSPSALDLIAPFSYLFILFTLFLLAFLLLQLIRRRIRRFGFGFSHQLQVSVIFIIVVALAILGVITRSNIMHLYDNKNRDNLNEKTLSVLTELEHKVGDVETIPSDMKGYLSDLLYKFSLIFFSDINLYDTQGRLIASSRPQIFDEGLISRRIQPDAFYRLVNDRSLIHVRQEMIGTQEYLSAYMPFRNSNDQIIAYVNLPYFARQAELRRELADFLSAYINVYVLLIVLAVMLTLLVSRLITRPLMLIREKLGRVGIGKANEKIAWERKDEIGSLVEEYNRMVDELARSADLLARSERESAWREMARQVAHEIKNPLTPMKLSVQHLQKAWNEQSPDFEKRITSFTRTIVEQIDALSEIASEFSDFAKMPVARLDRIDLLESIRAAANLYRNAENIHIAFEFPPHPCPVMADPRQLLRAFNNLVQNATEAIGNSEKGLISLRVSESGEFYRVEVADNGPGITEEQSTRIFSPSFTTKTSGMGLGLAMVRSMVTSIGGKVSFESVAGEGATFIVEIPRAI